MITDELRERLDAEIKRQGREMKELSIAAGLNESYVRDALKRGRGSIGNLVPVARLLGFGPEWLHGVEPKGHRPSNAKPPSTLQERTTRSATLEPNATGRDEAPTYGSPLPVLGVARGGDDGELVFNGEVIETIPRPPELEGVEGAYSSYVLGTSMAPRFKEGEKVWVHPRRPPRRGDDVIVQVAADEPGDPPKGFIKEFVGYRGGELVLSQHNPQTEIRFPREDVVSVHVIVGSLFR